MMPAEQDAGRGGRGIEPNSLASAPIPPRPAARPALA